MRQRFCKVCRGWHDLSEPWPAECVKPREDRASDLPCPTVLQFNDDMPPTQSMLDGKYYTSKRAMRQSYKDHNAATGENIVEVGNDSSVMNPKPRPKTKPDRKAIKAAVGKAFSQAGLGA